MAFLHRLVKYFGNVPSSPRDQLPQLLAKFSKTHVHHTCKDDFRAGKCQALLQRFFFGNGTSVSTKWHHKRAMFLVGRRKFRAFCCAKSACCMEQASTAAGDPYQTRALFRKNLARLLGLQIKRPKPKNPYAPKPKRPAKKGKAKKAFKEEKPYEVKSCTDLPAPKPKTCKKRTTRTLDEYLDAVMKKTNELPDREIDSKKFLAIAHVIAKSRLPQSAPRHRRHRVKGHTKIVKRVKRKASAVTVSANANGTSAVGGTVYVSPGVNAVNSQKQINIYHVNHAHSHKKRH